MNMNNNESAVLDMSDVASFDENTSPYLELETPGQAAPVEKQEAFSDYISRTSSESNYESINDNLVASYLKSQGKSEDDIKDLVIEGEDGSETSIFELDKETQKKMVASFKQGTKEEHTPTYSSDDLIIEGDEDLEEIVRAYQEGNLEGIIDLLKENNLINTKPVTNLTEEEVLIITAQNNCPTCDDDEIENHVSNIMRGDGRLKAKMVQEARKKVEYLDRLREQEYEHTQRENYLQESRIDKDRFIKSMSGMSEIYGIENDIETVREISDYLYNYDQNSDTTEFLRDISTDPQMRYKAAWFAKYGDQVIDIYQNEIKEAFQKGKESVLKTMPSSKPKNYISNTIKKGNGNRILDISEI